MAYVMLHSKHIPLFFWAKAITTAVYIINRVYLRPGKKQSPFEIWNGRKPPSLKYFGTFGSKCYILRDREHLGKFDSRSNKGFFVGYSLNSRAYRVYIIESSIVMESVNVVVDDIGITEHISDDDDEFVFTPSSS